jgi:hypothetical protein
MDKIEKDIEEINGEISTIQLHIKDVEKKIENKQKDYDIQLDVLKQVLVSYQRGGPASYLEILLGADNLTQFLEGINLIKDISHNVNGLLTSLEDGKKELQKEKDKLAENVLQLEEKKEELEIPLSMQKELKEDQEAYLASLKEDRAYYQGQLDNLVQVWDDCKLIFTDIMAEISNIVQKGYFTSEDLNLNIGFFQMNGSIKEDTFNNILKEHSKLTEIKFHFYKDQVVIEIPGKHLILTGNFVLSEDNSILFEVKEGSFYEMPLEASSIEELFRNGPLKLDFKKLAADTVMFDFKVDKLQVIEGSLEFEILPVF